jgi:hypothetical protein
MIGVALYDLDSSGRFPTAGSIPMVWLLVVQVKFADHVGDGDAKSKAALRNQLLVWTNRRFALFNKKEEPCPVILSVCQS